MELYRRGGVRGVEIGSVMFGRPRDGQPDETAAMELVRLAIPRRTYTQSHIDYVAEVVIDVGGRRDHIGGCSIVSHRPGLTSDGCFWLDSLIDVETWNSRRPSKLSVRWPTRPA